MGEGRADAQSAGHAPDFSWVVGRLEWADFEGGFWVLRFGDDGAEHRGELVLGTPQKLKDARTGDLVRIQGSIAAEQFGFQMAGTRYDVEAATVLSRS